MSIPINESINAQTDLALSKTYSKIEGFYFVSGFIYKNKTRLYSSPIASLFAAEQIYNEYIDILKSLNGGNVTLYKINADDYEVLAASFC